MSNIWSAVFWIRGHFGRGAQAARKQTQKADFVLGSVRVYLLVR